MNSFGTSTTRYPLYDARRAREERMRFRREMLPALERASSFCMSAGRWPSRGWFLMARRDYDKLDKYSTSLQLEIGAELAADNVRMLKGLSIVQAQCATPGLPSDPDALYLVEVTDARGLLCNRWYQRPLTRFYNIRAAAHPRNFILETGKPQAGSAPTPTHIPWTWSEMLQDMWLALPQLGPWPGLPYTPLGTPEGFWFPGTPGWIALCDVLDYLGLTVAVDNTSTNPYTIVRQNAADTTFSKLQTKYRTHLEDDLEWIDEGSGRVPGSVDVIFRRRDQTYGNLWTDSPVHTVTVTGPSVFSGSPGKHYIWADYTVGYDASGNAKALDVSVALEIATERADNYYDRVHGGFMTQIYAGALPFKTGSLCDGVKWHMDYQRDDGHAGWRTKLVYGGIDPPFPEVELRLNGRPNSVACSGFQISVMTDLVCVGNTAQVIKDYAWNLMDDRYNTGE